MIDQRIPSIGRQELHQLPPLLLREARADAHMLQRARIVEEPQQQRSHRRLLAFLVPSKAGHHAVAIALVLHLEHHALVRLVGPCNRLGHHSVEAGAFEAAEPVGRDARIVSCRCQMEGRRRGG